jgi:hypothetical protein
MNDHPQTQDDDPQSMMPPLGEEFEQSQRVEPPTVQSTFAALPSNPRPSLRHFPAPRAAKAIVGTLAACALLGIALALSGRHDQPSPQHTSQTPAIPRTTHSAVVRPPDRSRRRARPPAHAAPKRDHTIRLDRARPNGRVEQDQTSKSSSAPEPSQMPAPATAQAPGGPFSP